MVRTSAAGASRPVASTPCPSRTISIRRSTSVSVLATGSTSATSSRSEFVPQSIAATLIPWPPSRCAAPEARRLVHLPVIPYGIKAPRQGGERLPGQLRWAGSGGPVPARGPAGAAVMGAAARVTSRGGDTGQVRPGAAVRDAGQEDRRDPAARAGGDAGRRGQVAVAGELAARAGQHPPGRLGDPDRQAGQVEEVPRSSVNTKVI